MDVKFQFPEKFQNIIVRMGGFHVIIFLMQSIYSRFKGFGFVELLATVGSLGGSGTIESALRGGDVKLGVRLLLFEALYQLTLEMLEEVSLSSESKESIKLRKLV